MSVIARIRTVLQQTKDSLVLSGFPKTDSAMGKIVAGVGALYVVVVIVLGVWWSATPSAFDMHT